MRRLSSAVLLAGLGGLCAEMACHRAPPPGASDAQSPGVTISASGAADPAPSGAAALDAAAPRVPSPLSVLLITVDALRADVPWVGYPRPIAPNLSRLAEQSVVYTRAYALSTYTSMSLGGLLGGRYPSELPRDGRATSSFPPEALFLAEILREHGVRTLAAHGHVYFAGDTGIAQGFDDWRLVPKITSRPAREDHVVDAELSDLMRAALEEHAKQHPGRRFFAWAHFMDPHASYAPHDEIPRWRGSPYETDAGSVTPVPPGVPLSKVGQALRNAYDAEVAFSDLQVGRLLDWVGRQPWAATTAIVVTSDHGEAFGEHPSYFEHGKLLYDVTARVPLLFRLPGARPLRIDARRSQIDLARTLLELLGVPAPASLRGQSLVPELFGAPATDRDVIVDMPYTDQTPRQRALIHDGKKLIVTETEERPELFDLDADPGEQFDLASKNPALRAELERRWTEQNAALPDYPAPRRGRRQY